MLTQAGRHSRKCAVRAGRIVIQHVLEPSVAERLLQLAKRSGLRPWGSCPPEVDGGLVGSSRLRMRCGRAARRAFLVAMHSCAPPQAMDYGYGNAAETVDHQRLGDGAGRV